MHFICRVTKSEEWCQLQTQHPESIAKLQNDLKNDRVAFGRIESSALELRPVICCHVIDFIDHCNQLLDFQFEDAPSARRSNKWQCSERNCQSTLPFSSNSSFLEVVIVVYNLSNSCSKKYFLTHCMNIVSTNFKICKNLGTTILGYFTILII